MGISQRELKKELRKRLKLSHRELRKLLYESAEDGYNADISRLPSVQAVPFEKNKVIQDIVDASARMASGDLENITQTIGMVAPDGKALPLTKAYEQLSDFAYTKVATGAQDYNSAVRDATRQLVNKGIQYIDYESGQHCSVEAAVRRNVMSTLGNMQEQISQRNHDDLGADGWEISAHGGSAPDHEPIQGKQYSDAEYKALNNSLIRRIGTLNCGHAAYPIILGVSQPVYSSSELEQMRKENEDGVTVDGKHYTIYEATQFQRQIERAIRKQKRRVLVEENIPDSDQLQASRVKLTVLSQEYSRFSKAAGLRTQVERTHVGGIPGRRKHDANSSLDYMGKPQNFMYKDHKENEVVTKAYAVEGHKGIFTQTNSKDAQNTIALIEREKQVIPQIQTVNEIIIKKDLDGIAAYEHTTNRLYVHEKISDPEFVKVNVASGYFVAENAEDTLRHEMYHKEHHDLIDKKTLTSNKDRATVKQELETELRDYVVRQWLNERSYITKYVSENAYVAFVRYNSLNELIAEVMLAKDKGIIKDNILVRKVGEMFHDAHDVG